MKNIFVSYAHKDTAKVKVLLSMLKGVKISGWLDNADIAAGEETSSVLRNSIKKASILLVFISPDSINNRWIEFEVSAGQALGKIIIPVIINGKGIEKELPISIADTTYIDGRNKALDEVVSEIQIGIIKEPIASFSQSYLNGFSKIALPKEVVIRSLSEPTSSQYFYLGRPCTRNIARFSIKVRKVSSDESSNSYSSIILKSYGERRNLNTVVWGTRMYHRDIPHDSNVEPLLLLNLFLEKYGVLQSIGSFNQKLLYQGEALQVPPYVNSKDKAGFYLAKIRSHVTSEDKEEYEYMALYDYEIDKHIVIIDFSFTVCISRYKKSLKEKGLWVKC